VHALLPAGVLVYVECSDGRERGMTYGRVEGVLAARSGVCM